MKYLKYTILSITVLIFSNSCQNDFLEVPDETELLRQSYVVDLKSSKEFLNGVYIYMGERFFDGLLIDYPEVIADNMKPFGGSLEHPYAWAQIPSEDGATVISSSAANANGAWNAGYRVVRSCNFIIESVDQFRSEDPAEADNIKGQAYAIRALAHFYIVNYFAQPFNFTSDGSHPGVPYITSSVWNSPVSRQSVAEVYESLVDDLTQAISLMPVELSDTRYISRDAAQALLARVYLFQGDYANAKSTALDLCERIPLMTIDQGYPADIYKLKAPSETESIFQLPPAEEGSAGSAGNYYTFFAGALLSADYYIFVATSDIVSTLQEDPADARNAWVTEHDSEWLITKYPVNVVPGFGWPASSYFHTLIRSSEMFLTVAEAAAKTSDENTAWTYIDAIRKRANPAATSSNETGEALLDLIYKERRKELCFEGLRMFDLLRLGLDVNRIDALNPSAKSLPYPSDKAIAPLPTTDVNLSGLPQNPGY